MREHLSYSFGDAAECTGEDIVDDEGYDGGDDGCGVGCDD